MNDNTCKRDAVEGRGAYDDTTAMNAVDYWGACQFCGWNDGYLIHRKRGFEAMSLLLGADYAGKMTHDGWAAYDRFFQAIHQTCLGHLLRRCKELLETATRGAVTRPYECTSCPAAHPDAAVSRF